ncbi:MAG TPA: oxygenase MpaB family protein [Acidimicrobiales bacterium]|nr:oxygenase MpaB family protein [Acidimicrobiales bacterium]
MPDRGDVTPEPLVSLIPSLPFLPSDGSIPTLPPNPLADRFEAFFDRSVRPDFFKKMDFAAPLGDPGWFGPDSPVWHVHANMPVMFFGLSCAAFMENLDPGIAWMGYDHSRIVERVDGVPTGRVDPTGARVRFAHSLAFFTATAYGPTPTAERAARAVRAMHHTIKGTRPDGAPYDADDPEWLRWNYATVVWGIASAHERYHARPLDDIDDYYRAFVRVGEALGGTDLPRTKGEVLDCLEERLPKLAVTPIAASRTWPALGEGLPAGQKPVFWLLDWAERDLLPRWGQKLLLYRPPNALRIQARRQVLRTALNGLHVTTGPMREFRQAQARVAGHQLDEVPGSTAPAGADEPMDRQAVEATY